MGRSVVMVIVCVVFVCGDWMGWDGECLRFRVLGIWIGWVVVVMNLMYLG